MTAEDARLAVEHGLDGIIVSNHGGRQLDWSQATLDALPGDRRRRPAAKLEILMDGGIRRGTDVLKALALGARAVLIGRPVQWGLATGGDARDPADGGADPRRAGLGDGPHGRHVRDGRAALGDRPQER